MFNVRTLGVWIGFGFGILGWELMRMGYPWFVYGFMFVSMFVIYLITHREEKV